MLELWLGHPLHPLLLHDFESKFKKKYFSNYYFEKWTCFWDRHHPHHPELDMKLLKNWRENTWSEDFPAKKYFPVSLILVFECFGLRPEPVRIVRFDPVITGSALGKVAKIILAQKYSGWTSNILGWLHNLVTKLQYFRSQSTGVIASFF